MRKCGLLFEASMNEQICPGPEPRAFFKNDRQPDKNGTDVIDAITHEMRSHQFFDECFFGLSFDNYKQSFHHGRPPMMFFSHNSPTE